MIVKYLQEETLPLLHEKILPYHCLQTVLLAGVRDGVQDFQIYPTVVTVDILATEKTGY